MSHHKFCLARKMLKIKFFGYINYKETLMQKGLCILFISSEILILSVFRANLKIDIKNDTNARFSHSLRMIYTNPYDTKERLQFFFTPCNQILHKTRSFWYIWIKSCKKLPFFEKTEPKKIELLNFKSKFQNHFSSCDKSNYEKKEP